MRLEMAAIVSRLQCFNVSGQWFQWEIKDNLFTILTHWGRNKMVTRVHRFFCRCPDHCRLLRFVMIVAEPSENVFFAPDPWWHTLSIAWWRHQMETFPALLAICAGNSPVPDEFPAQRPVTRSVDVFFDLRLNKRLSEQSWGWWFETLSRPLWRHCNGTTRNSTIKVLLLPQLGTILVRLVRSLSVSYDQTYP